MMYELVSFLVIFVGLGTAVYALCKLEARDEVARQPTQRMPVVRRKL